MASMNRGPANFERRTASDRNAISGIAIGPDRALQDDAGSGEHVHADAVFLHRAVSQFTAGAADDENAGSGVVLQHAIARLESRTAGGHDSIRPASEAQSSDDDARGPLDGDHTGKVASRTAATVEDGRPLSIERNAIGCND